jgi:hypothetical protein
MLFVLVFIVIIVFYELVAVFRLQVSGILKLIRPG